jgi:hypothetical protein
MPIRHLDRTTDSPLPRRRRHWPAGRLRSVAEGALIGLLIGLLDISSDGNPAQTAGLYLLAGMGLGIRNAGRASYCWAPLGVSLYLVHLIAIACGQKPPFVESSFRQAAYALDCYAVAGLGLLVGVIGRVISVNSFGFFRRADGPPVRFLPVTVPDWLFLVFCFGLGLGGHRLAHGPKTVYAAGYDETKFQQLRIGMTRSQVEALAGPPLQKVPDSVNGPEVWFYSLGATSLDDYWRRWVFFEDGKIFQILSDYWED